MGDFMRKMLDYFIRVLVVFFVCVSFDAKAYSATSSDERADIVDHEMDCVTSNINGSNKVTWQDVCYTNATPQEGYSIKEEDVNQELDQVERQLKAQYPDTDAITSESIHSEIEKNVQMEDNNPGEESYFYKFFDPRNPLNTLETGVEYFNYEYIEPDFMSLDGNMWGGYATYTHRIKERGILKSFKDIFSENLGFNVVKLDFHYSRGDLDYDGSGSDYNVPNFKIDARAVLGLDIPTSNRFRFTPYFGFGYRYLLDDQGGRYTTSNNWGYDRESSYFYSPVGVETHFKFSNAWSLETQSEYDIFWGGKQISHLEDGPGAIYDSLKNDQSKGYGARGEIKVVYSHDNFDLFAGPFIRFWSIDNSEASPVTITGVIVGGGLEPANTTTEFGMKLGARF